jgi:hypothetical protein
VKAHLERLDAEARNAYEQDDLNRKILEHKDTIRERKKELQKKASEQAGFYEIAAMKQFLREWSEAYIDDK